MMVSKMAVAALVLIVSCPILLGYALNLSEVTVTDYRPEGEPVNVTQLLQTSTGYSIAYGNIYNLNTNFETLGGLKQMPVYESTSTTTKSSLQMTYHDEYLYYTNQYFWIEVKNLTSDLYAYMGEGSQIHIDDLTDNGNTTNHPVNNVVALHYYHDTHVLEYLKTNDTTGSFTITSVNDSWIFFQQYQPSSHVYYWCNLSTETPTYVDFSSGFHFNYKTYDPDMVQPFFIKLPQNTMSYLMTINLDSVTSSYCPLIIDDDYQAFHLEKNTTGGVVTWTCSGNDGDQTIYYDSTRSDNTYQLYVERTNKYELNGMIHYETHAELRYVGGWPTVIGEAPSYITYEYNGSRTAFPYDPDDGFDSIHVYTTDPANSQTTSPTLRMDNARYVAFEYPMIENKNYDPSAFKLIPSTKISNINRYGAYLTFGGNTYMITDGTITLNSHKVPVKDMMLDSIPSDSGYDNRINGTVVSTTLTPSTITFGGQWGANITTDLMKQTTYTKTEWTPGEFGWDGIDTNFLLAGLLTSVCVFIGLGLYVRRSRSSLWPILIVCGGAILLFFCMI